MKVEELRSRLNHHIDRAVLPMHRQPTNDGQIIIIIIIPLNNTEPIKDKCVATVLEVLVEPVKFRRVILIVVLMLSIEQVFQSTASPSLPSSSPPGASQRKAPRMLGSRSVTVDS